MSNYEAPMPEWWTGRTDGTDRDVLRWHQLVHLAAPVQLPSLAKGQQGIAIIGFASHEGVRRNYGRTGAAYGPNAIRKAAANLPSVADHIYMADVGNVLCVDSHLEKAQEQLATTVQQVRQQQYLPIVLGGGHEMGYGSFSGLMPLAAKKEYGIISFDAHFDLREYADNGPNSGTWALQAAHYCAAKHIPFHYLAMGIQQYANTRRLFEMAAELGAHHFLAEHFTNDQLSVILTAINAIIANADVVQLSLDMDVFASCYAPGVSAPSYNGIAPNAMFKRLLRHVVLSGKVGVIDIAELNPQYDVDDRTARLAAAFLFDIVQAADINAEYPV